MSPAREDILARIRAANGRSGPPDADALAALRARIARSDPHVLPARARGTAAELVERFVGMARRAGAGVARIGDRARVPTEIAGLLAREALGDEVVVAPDPGLDALPWHNAPRLVVRRGRAEPSDAVGVTPALAGIAETGTLLVAAGATTPNTLHFLPETHIAVLAAGDVVGGYEAAWERLRATSGGANRLPRTVTLITGPSRTSDIEKTLQIGVHGPRRLYIVLIDGEET